MIYYGTINLYLVYFQKQEIIIIQCSNKGFILLLGNQKPISDYIKSKEILKNILI